jgi:hypothetical protein
MSVPIRLLVSVAALAAGAIALVVAILLAESVL